MTGSGTSPEPHRGAFDPEETSLVLRRAIELAADREQQAVGEALTGEDLAEVAQQAGIPAPALAAAVAEARAGLTQERSIVDRLIGPAKVSASTHLSDDEAAAAASLQRWFEVEHGLSAYVRQDGVVIASRRGGLPGAVGSGVRRVQGTGGLARVRSVRAGTAAADDGGVICVVADISNRRNEAVAGGTAVTGGGAAVIGIVALVAGPVALVALPAAIAAGLGTARLAHKRTITQVEEQVAHTTEAAAKNEAP
ncbi:MAG: hypothetical protein AAFO29_22365, partial [Actinomycetota bacterium]